MTPSNNPDIGDSSRGIAGDGNPSPLRVLKVGVSVVSRFIVIGVGGFLAATVLLALVQPWLRSPFATALMRSSGQPAAVWTGFFHIAAWVGTSLLLARLTRTATVFDGDRPIVAALLAACVSVVARGLGLFA